MQEAWQSRQTQMEEWYQELVATPEDAAEALLSELRPHADFLRGLQGRILDIGGGAGLPAAFLPPQAELVTIDPSQIWLEEPWPSLRRRLAPGRSDPSFVLGVGEDLPFADATFDAALSLWSLNHARDPARCLAEMHRVLKPGGTALLVLEDMEPNWSDLLRLAALRVRKRLGRPPHVLLHWRQEHLASVKAAARHKLLGREWPLQDDHLRIRCRDLEGWLAGSFWIARRDWIDGFLSYELRSF